MIDTFATLPLAAIVSSLTNPRKTFNQPKLAELAESIKASGVHQPILVRPLPGARVGDTDRAVTHEVVCGERRYRASHQVGLDTIPALVRDLTDAQVMEIQLIENLQRDDLTELEEAEGYQALMEASGLNADAIASKIAKSRSYVFARLKLLDLSVECKEAMRAGQIDASRALLIARIPDTSLQTKALAEATRVDHQGAVCSVRALQSWLQANVMLKLDQARFSITDPRLVATAGSCTDCPKRTGANPDLFSDVQNVDICTDPVCYKVKEATHRESIVATAEKRGMTLIEGDEAEVICSAYNDRLIGYSPLTQERQDTADGQPATLGQLLGKDPEGAVLIENPWTKELIAAVPTDEAEAMLLARGLVKAVEAKATNKADIDGEIKRLQDKTQKEITKRFRNDAFAVLANVVHDLGPNDDAARELISPNLLRAWWLRQTDNMGNKELSDAFGIQLNVEETRTYDKAASDANATQIRLHVQACDSSKLFKALALWMVMEDNPNYFFSNLEDPTLFHALAVEVDVDLDSIEKDASDAVLDENAAEIKKLKAQLKGSTTPAKSPTTEPPAAQAKGRGGKKPKTSPAQAKAQIAAAMQAQEGTNPGADAQGDDGAGEQPVATSAADAPGVAQAGFVAAWPMPERAA